MGDGGAGGVGDGGAGGVGVEGGTSADGSRATLQMRNRTAAIAPLGDITYLIWSLLITGG